MKHIKLLLSLLCGLAALFFLYVGTVVDENFGEKMLDAFEKGIERSHNSVKVKA